MLVPFVGEKEGNSVKGCDADQGVNDSGNQCEIGAENGSNQIEVQNSYQSPVQTTYNHENEYNFFQSLSLLSNVF